ncbi:MAG: transcription antitermination factor NusB [Thermodesulfobacteriota bacterium]
MGKRRLSREFALKFLYQLDVLSDKNDEKHLDFDAEINSFLNTQEEIRDADTKKFMITLSKGVYENMDGIDRIITKYSDNWKISRMSKIDRNILRLAVFEMLNLSNIPHPVTINEAVDIAKKYGTNESGSFINGIVDRVRIAFEKGEDN